MLLIGYYQVMDSLPFNVEICGTILLNKRRKERQINIPRSTLLILMSEIEFDLSKFLTAKHFASWLGFTPNRKYQGVRSYLQKLLPKTSPLEKAIRDVANALGNSKSRLGDFFRRFPLRLWNKPITYCIEKGILLWVWVLKT